MSAGVVYLLHFDRPYHHAAHYIGWTNDLERRIVQHQSGTGARLIEVVTNAGITFQLARTWPGDRKLERRIKKLGSGVRVCPICSPRRRWGFFLPRSHASPAERLSALVVRAFRACAWLLSSPGPLVWRQDA